MCNKNESYNKLERACKIYLPKKRTCTMEFLKQILSDEKKSLSTAGGINMVKVPR